jgi:myo-inositol 2-dehydrogenase/D-chiro-inositol 1-dehydrogenase
MLRGMQQHRRSFLKGAAAGAASVMFVKPESVFGTPANSAVQIGIIGSGGRGLYIGNYFTQQTDAKVVAAHDVFEDRLQAAQKRFQLPANRLYKGLEGYQELLASDVDAVAIESPPYFHPEQAAAAVKAGKHVYLAKPVCVDVAGAQSIIASAERAQGRLSFLVDFQTRVREVFIEAARRVHEGAIGTPVCGQVFYHTGRLKTQTRPDETGDQTRLRNWTFDKVLSGDVIVEQHIHVLDVANWYLKAHPLKAYGTGGRMARTDVGDCWDHFLCTYWYPGDVKVQFSSSQFLRGFHDMCIRVYGTAGTVDSHYGASVNITGDQPWKGAEKDDTFNGGAIANVKAFVESLKTGKFLNNGAPGAESTLTSILGRMAAYEGRVVTWDEMMKSKARLRADLKV